MKKIRIGNDIHFKWMITREGAIESFDGKTVDVVLCDQTGKRWPCKWSINAEDGCVDGIFYGHMQQTAGTYSLTLTENRGDKEMATVDRTAAWQLVARQDNACEGEDEGALGVSVEQMASEINVGKAEGVTLDRVATGVASGEWLNLRNGERHSCCGGTPSTKAYLYSFSYGWNCSATGAASTAFGRFSIASEKDSFSCGRYNYETNGSLFCIGCGSMINGNRLNSEVTLGTTDEKNGYKYFLGVGGYKGKEIEDGMKSLQEVVADLEAYKTKKKTKRVKRYVIGRAISPGSCQDTGHENWYCFGTRVSGYLEDGSDERSLVLNIKTTMMIKLFVNEEEIALDYNNGDFPFFTTILENYTRIYYILNGNHRVYAFKVSSAEMTQVDGKDYLELHLAMAPAPETLSSESTHHSFIKGNRKWVGNFLSDSCVTLRDSDENVFTLRVGGPPRKVLWGEQFSFVSNTHIYITAKKWLISQISYFSGCLPIRTGKKKRRFMRCGNFFYIPDRHRHSITGIFLLREISHNCGRKGRSVLVQIGAVRLEGYKGLVLS